MYFLSLDVSNNRVPSVVRQALAERRAHSEPVAGLGRPGEEGGEPDDERATTEPEPAEAKHSGAQSDRGEEEDGQGSAGRSVARGPEALHSHLQDHQRDHVERTQYRGLGQGHHYTAVQDRQCPGQFGRQGFHSHKESGECSCCCCVLKALLGNLRMSIVLFARVDLLREQLPCFFDFKTYLDHNP